MAFKLYNTLTKRKEVFTTFREGEVRMYTCGPTVHDYAHVGNFRTFVAQDLLRRWLRYLGYRVIQVMNITDVDEKTIERAKRKRVGLKDITSKYASAFFRDIELLNIERAEYYPFASEHISEMATLAERLLEKGYAFIAESNDVFFNVLKAANYGRLSGKTPKHRLRAKTVREDYDEAKHFALWVACRRGEDVCWESNLGKGRPGWHVECAALSLRYLGERVDIASGGEDLIFPHHENSLALCEAIAGEPYVRFFVHIKHLLWHGRKMSKTLRNYHTLGEIIKKGYSPREVRLVLLQEHYRRHLDFTFEKLDRARAKLKALDELLSMPPERSGGIRGEIRAAVQRMRSRFIQAMNDDLDVETALSAYWEFITEMREARLSEDEIKEVRHALLDLDRVLGLVYNVG
jgi:cysteinyl-tRNA synthetase